ncbi:serine/arginine repetitive matrix protein 1 isoform X2 [Nilaparvata lugens]|uniref:serine/arginine repetitive matrix protein 1 isoform X2 n=1 Tax=Nilaparvata lugens TaxID=108931 RepID=UPI00193D44EC|nr:serine/arginine repetitive matrix protein 1 isoform X2 [Nilaparvata lugens]
MMMHVLAILNVLFIVIEGYRPYYNFIDDGHQSTTGQPSASSQSPNPPKYLRFLDDGQPSPPPQRTPSPSQRTPSPPQRTPSPPQRTPSPPQRTPSPPQRTPSPPPQQHYQQPHQQQTQGQKRPAPERASTSQGSKRQMGVTMAPTSVIELFRILDLNGDGQASRKDYKRVKKSDLYKTNAEVRDLLDSLFKRKRGKHPSKTNFNSSSIDLATLNNGNPFSSNDLDKILKIPMDMIESEILTGGRESITASELATHLRSIKRIRKPRGPQ